MLAANSRGAERAHIYAAHFSLSHAGWGLTYPLAGFLTTALGFGAPAWVFSALLAAISVPLWLRRIRGETSSHAAVGGHEHTHSAFDPPGAFHAHEHRHGTLVHSHPHRHEKPHTHE